ncbi:PilN domain-containing protein [Kosakonia sp. BYX6]|uniref:PilN domain-containing protein n=1 Tax=Kosakonia calanthes TaxID=3139408 RepID=A0ABZ3BBR0_9ENTR
MQPLVNFIPWRRQKQRRCLRFWAAMFIATALAITLCAALWRARLAEDVQSAVFWRQSDDAVLNGLIAGEKPLRSRLEQWQQAQARLLRRESTQAWRQTLLTLAAALPQKAWLTQLRWRQNQLELSGLARSVNALSELEQRLQKTVGFRLQPMGAMARDAEGRWQFNYQLNRE